MTDATNRRRPLFVFVHVPKTAGSTLRTILGMNEPGARSQALGNVFKGGGGIDRDLMRRLGKDKAPDLKGVGLVRGHFPLGVREYLPKNRDLRCFTLLREPIDRTLSHYFQVVEGGRSFGLRPLPAEATLDDALEAGYIHDNLHTRMLSGLPEPFGEVTDEMLEQAKQNLHELAFFGLTERFDESLVLAKKKLGFDGILYRSNGRVNTARPRGEDVPAELMRAAERCNRYDIELYRYAEERFEKAPERKSLDFEIELAALRAARDEGQLEPIAPVPGGFAGDEETWRMLVGAKAVSQRLRWELTQSAAKATANQERVRDLKQRMERMEDVPATMKQLEKEVGRLTSTADSKTRELEKARERLAAASSTTRELERELERLTAATEPGPKAAEKRGSRKRDTKSANQRSHRARPKRETKGSAAKSTRARPKRDRRRESAKGSTPRTRRRGSGKHAGSDDQEAGDEGG